MSYLRRIFGILIILPFLSSCSTYIYLKDDLRKGVNITSTPSGAYFYVDGWIAKTPANVTLSSESRNSIIKFRKEGYKEKTVKIGSKFRFFPTIIGNLLWNFFYFNALAIDMGKHGAAWDLERNISVKLEKVSEND